MKQADKHFRYHIELFLWKSVRYKKRDDSG